MFGDQRLIARIAMIASGGGLMNAIRVLVLAIVCIASACSQKDPAAESKDRLPGAPTQLQASIPLSSDVWPQFVDGPILRKENGRYTLHVAEDRIKYLIELSKDGDGVADFTLSSIALALHENSDSSADSSLANVIADHLCSIHKESSRGSSARLGCLRLRLEHPRGISDYREGLQSMREWIAFDLLDYVPEELPDPKVCTGVASVGICTLLDEQGSFVEAKSARHALLELMNRRLRVSEACHRYLSDQNTCSAVASEAPPSGVDQDEWDRAAAGALIRSGRTVAEVSVLSPEFADRLEADHRELVRLWKLLTQCKKGGCPSAMNISAGPAAEVLALEDSGSQCAGDLGWWEGVRSRGFSPGLGAFVFKATLKASRLRSCLRSGDGIAEDYALASQLGAAYILSPAGSRFATFSDPYDGAIREAVIADPPESGAAYFLSLIGPPSQPPVPKDVVRASVDREVVLLIQSLSKQWRSEISKDIDLTARESIAGLSLLGSESVGIRFNLPFGASAAPVQGSGFFVSLDGHLITNAHVVQDCSEISLPQLGQIADVLSIDRTNDLALLRTSPNKGGVIGRIGPFPEIGQAVTAIGFPVSGMTGGNVNATDGTVTALGGLGGDTRHVQFSAPIQPGSSGGPLLDENGSLVGVVVATANPELFAKQTGVLPQGMNYAVKAAIASDFLRSNGIVLEEFGFFSRRHALKEGISATVQVNCSK